jgi:hypothetical protein
MVKIIAANQNANVMAAADPMPTYDKSPAAELLAL